MDVLKFISENLLIVIACTYTMGIFFKQSGYIKDKFIPLFLMVFAVVFSMVIEGFNPMAFLQGVLCWGVSIGINQTAKQLCKGEE